MCEQICKNCRYWNVMEGVAIPNPSLLARTYRKVVLIAPCDHPNASMTDAPHTFAYMDEHASCAQYHDGFEESAASRRKTKDWRDTFQGERYPIELTNHTSHPLPKPERQLTTLS